MTCECAAMTVELEGLWQEFSRRLLQFIRRRVPDDDIAEDMLQDVFVRIHAHLGTLRDRGKLESWIYQITRNAIVDYYRERRTAVELTEALAEGEDTSDERSAEAELAASLREMVEALPEPYRQALLLSQYGGLSQKELAERLGISFSGAKSRVQRARQKIRDELLLCCHFEFDRRGTIIDYYEHCCCCAGS